MKRIFTIFLTLFVASSVWAFDFFIVDRIAYETINENEVSVTSDPNPGSGDVYYWDDIIIPSSVTYNGNNYKVTSIGGWAFSGYGLTSITIPNSVTSIGQSAFEFCESLTSITIPNSVTSIGRSAFEECSSLTSVTIPNSVTSIGDYAFRGVDYIIYSGTAEGRPWGADKVYGAKDENFYYEDGGKTIISKYIGEGGDVVIPNSVTSIGDYAFRDCSSLTSIIIPNSVTSIGSCAFLSCSGLTSVTIPNSVTSIGDYAFRDCSSLTSIIIPNSITSIGSCAFLSCSGLTSLTIPNSVTSIGESAFVECSSLTSVTIPNSVTSIGTNAFRGCSSLTSIIIPNSLDVSWASISIKKDGICYNVLNSNEVSVDFIDAESSLTDINIPSAITAGNTFTVTSIDDYAFSRSTISSIVVPENLDISNASIRIEKDGIYYNVISNNEVSVDRAESSLTEVNIPNMITAGMTFAVTEIEEYAFSDCSNLKSVSIPSGVTKVEEGAFSGCTLLKDVTCLAAVPPTAYANSFENYNGYLYIPCESKDDYDFASCWGSFKHVDCIGAETVELTKDEVAVVPEKTEAVFSMPKNENANTYTLTISNNGVTFCSLTFNAQGQLANIDFSTNKSYELKSGVEAFQFTVTGLSSAEDYGYSFKALASNKSVLKEYSGSFTTKNADGTGGSVQGGGEGSGQGSQGGEGGEGGSTAVSEVSNTTAVTIANGQILVNGEAPIFVVTVSGKKIANANLKAGVYFVVVDGKMVGVSVR